MVPVHISVVTDGVCVEHPDYHARDRSSIPDEVWFIVYWFINIFRSYMRQKSRKKQYGLFVLHIIPKIMIPPFFGRSNKNNSQHIQTKNLTTSLFNLQVFMRDRTPTSNTTVRLTQTYPVVSVTPSTLPLKEQQTENASARQ